MSSHSLIRRYRESLLGRGTSSEESNEEPSPGESRTNSSLWQRYWTSLLGFRPVDEADRLRNLSRDPAAWSPKRVSLSYSSEQATREIVEWAVSTIPSVLPAFHLTLLDLPRPLLLPPAVADFVGRDTELLTLVDLLNPASRTGAQRVTSVVTGLGGVGKTTLAVQAGYTARQRGWFPGGVFFLDMRGNEDTEDEPGRGLPYVLRSLGIDPARIPPRVDEQGNLFRSLLGQLSKPILIIVDNVATEDQVFPLLPTTDRHRVLVTSRNALDDLAGQVLKLAALDQASGVELLNVAVDDYRVHSHPSAAAKLVELSGGLPLSLRIVASLLKRDPELSLETVTKKVAEYRIRAEVLDRNASSNEVSVAAAVYLTYSLLNDNSARVFGLLALNPSSEWSSGAAEALTNLPSHELRGILDSIAGANIIKASGSHPTDRPADRWVMHDLVHRYANSLSETYVDIEERERARDRLLDFYVANAREAGRHLLAKQNVDSSTFANRAEALSWLDAEWSNLVQAAKTAAEVGRNEIARDLVLGVTPYLALRHLLDDWREVAVIARQSAHALGDRSAEGAALDQLGLILQEKGQFHQAATAHQEAVEILREAGDASRQGLALENLGKARHQIRHFEEAIAAHRQAAEIFRNIGDNYRRGLALDNLGLALQEAGRAEEATGAFQEADVAYKECDDPSAGPDEFDGPRSGK